MAPDPRRTSLARHGGDRRRVGALGSARSSRRSFDPTHTLARGRPWRRAWTIIEGRAASRIPTIPGRLSGKSELQTGPLGVTRHLSGGIVWAEGLLHPAASGLLPEAPKSLHAAAHRKGHTGAAAHLIFKLPRRMGLARGFAPDFEFGLARDRNVVGRRGDDLVLPRFRGRGLLPAIFMPRATPLTRRGDVLHGTARPGV
jgi:hypothetical protein